MMVISEYLSLSLSRPTRLPLYFLFLVHLRRGAMEQLQWAPSAQAGSTHHKASCCFLLQCKQELLFSQCAYLQPSPSQEGLFNPAQSRQINQCIPGQVQGLQRQHHYSWTRGREKLLSSFCLKCKRLLSFDQPTQLSCMIPLCKV